MVDWPLVAARAIHFTAQISLAGLLGFMVIIAAPAHARAGITMSASLRRRLALLAGASVALALLSAIPWLLLVAQSMSAQPLPLVLSRRIFLTALMGTQFGHAWLIGAAILIVLIPLIVRLGTRRMLDALAALLAATSLAAAVWQGHAGAEEGFEGIVHVGADAIHLVAAGLWIGALLPLALLLGDAREERNRRGAIVAQAAAIAFSDFGLGCVSALLITGTLNAWFLVGSMPALFGTVYGQLLLLKLGLFASMLVLAAINRLRLLPRLATTDHGRKAAESEAAARSIERNALIEALIGLGIVAIVAALGTLVPGAHEQPWWPFPYRLAFDQIAAVPDLRNDAIGTGALALFGLALLAYGGHRRRPMPIVTGLVLFLGLGWRPIQLLTIDATPTAYYASTEPFSVRSIIAGGKIYQGYCVACHGRAGLGDGPLAAGLSTPPADLTYHLSAHSDGDLYWFVSHGMDGGVMPAFSPTLDETQCWDVIAALKAHADSELDSLSAKVATDAAPRAPDFAFPAEDGASGSLSALLSKSAVLLVFADSRQPPPINPLEASRSALAANGVAMVVITDDPDLRAVYRAYEPGRTRETILPVRVAAFLIDRDGYVRAAWRPGDAPNWSNPETLAEEVDAMSRLKLVPAAGLNVHVHQPS